MDVEALAVSKITKIIARCPTLKPFISLNDKTPFTDGHIDLHGGPVPTKANFRGRVGVQVKGRSRRSKRGLATYSVARTDLLGFQKDGGVLYFVVTINPDTAAGRPYYALLSPFAIQSILENAPADQDQVPVNMTALREDPASVERLVALALKTRAQNVSQGFDPSLFAHATSLTLHTAEGLDFTAPMTLAPGVSDYALVLNTAEGLSIPIPAGLHIIPHDYLERNVDLQVRSGAITYDGAVVRRLDDASFEAMLSEGLAFTLRTGAENPSTSVSLTLVSCLADRLKALEFFIAMLDTQVVEFNGRPSRLEAVEVGEASWLREHLAYLQKIAELFARLDVDMNFIDVDQIDEKLSRQLGILHRALVLNEEIADSSAEPSRALLAVGEWNLMVLVTHGSAAGKWQVVDPFAADTRRQFRWSTDQDPKDAIPVTAYDALDDEHLPKVLNLRLDSIVGAYEAIADFESTFGLATQKVLDLIVAADAGERRKEEFLIAAESLNSWLAHEQEGNPVHLVNGWQISSRRGPLSAEQRSDVRALKRTIHGNNADNADQIELACAILLQDAEEVDDLSRQMPVDRLEAMRQWPIWKLRSAN